MFDKELELILNDDFRHDIETILLNLPIYFYEVPASSTGKYHPSFSLGEGGLVRHTKVAVRIARELLQLKQFDFNDFEQDLIYGSLIIHDGLKYGMDYDVNSYFLHPQYISNFVIELLGQGKFKSERTTMIMLAHVVATHMGQWNTNKYSIDELPLPQTELDNFVHLCDYLSSRKFLDVKFDDDNNIIE